VVGGAESLPGVVIGAIYIWGTQYYLHGGYTLIASGLGILILLIVLPEGLGGLLYRLRDELLRALARRKHIAVFGLAPQIDEAAGPEQGAVEVLEELRAAAPDGDGAATRTPRPVDRR
jgi:hypothetical protein